MTQRVGSPSRSARSSSSPRRIVVTEGKLRDVSGHVKTVGNFHLPLAEFLVKNIPYVRMVQAP